ncbi:MAG: response regulator transcription factor [Pseudomonadota bacterium]
MAQAPCVLIVDDHPLFRDALEASLSRAWPGGVEARHAGSLAEAEIALAKGGVDLVLLDLNLSDASAFDGLARLKGARDAPPVYIVSATETATAFQRAKSLGAAGYLPKSLPPEDLAAALATALDGGAWFPEDTGAAENDAAARLSSLTPAQSQVLAGLADGLLNKQIAYEMGISEATVKAHMTAIFRKLGAMNRTQALLVYKSATSLDGHSAA